MERDTKRAETVLTSIDKYRKSIQQRSKALKGIKKTFKSIEKH